MRVLYFHLGKIEIHKGFVIKHKQVKDEIIVSYFVLIADDYFYKNLSNMPDNLFNKKYHAIFERLFIFGGIAREEIPYESAPIIYNMSNQYGTYKHVMVIDEISQKWFESNIRRGYNNIKANIVKRVFKIDM